MINRIFFIKALVITLLMCQGSSVEAKRLMAEMSYATFYTPQGGSYLETYLGVRGKSVVFEKKANGMFQGVLQIIMVFRKDSVIKTYRKYELLSPEQADTSLTVFDFIDQQRIPLEPGTYDLELTLYDRAQPDNKYNYHIPVEIFYDRQQVVVSGIEIVDSYKPSVTAGMMTKGGYDLIPRVSNFFSQSATSLTFYTEIYNSDTVLGEKEKLVASWYLQPYESGKKLDSYSRSKVIETRQVIPIFAEFDIKNLTSGNYNLSIEIRDKNNKIVGYNSLFIQRSNPRLNDSLMADIPTSVESSFAITMSNNDTLRDWVLSLRPIATVSEKIFIDNQAKEASSVNLQRFLNFFWQQRNEIDPLGAWLSYYSEVRKVNKLFGNKFRRGFDTDRGRVYLQYGSPNTITDRPFDASNSQMTNNRGGTTGQDGGLVPYQIWHYYTIKNQRNKKFVFYNPHLAGDDYTLLHSDAQGEFYNPQWQTQLKRIQLENVDNGQNGFDGQSGRYYNDPF
ncbi:MAG: hypothetical protein CVU06_05110 [Bacteroidetes bacterium HGW-Bacteroidetes-22]|nr:MAG: hypothetical protein CVU06_05110 [Bacteroidetes bacterium HGW-Bacteroidetes-22]